MLSADSKFTDVFVVETPLQMLNAIEARAYFRAKKSYLLVLTSPFFPQEAFSPLIEYNSWSRMSYIKIREKQNPAESESGECFWRKKIKEYNGYYKQFLCRRKLNNISKSLGHFHRLFLGNYLQTYMRHLGNRLKHDELILLDDGTDAVRVNEMRRLPKVEPKSVGLGGLKANLHRILHEWDYREVEHVTFFSAYELNLNGNDQLIKNEYEYLRSLSVRDARSDEVLFLGQCLVDDGWVSKEGYFRYLEKIKDYYSRQKLVYVPHKRESGAIINEIVQRLDLNIESYDVPIEFHLAKGVKPKEIASFFCSAIENCRIIFGNKLRVTAFCIESADLLCCHDFVSQLYGYWRLKQNENFKVIKI